MTQIKKEQSIENLTIEEKVIENPWGNAYWFARMLINNDKYSAIGKENRLLAEICVALQKIVEDNKLDSKTKLEISKEIIEHYIRSHQKVLHWANSILFHIFDNCTFARHVTNVRSQHRTEMFQTVSRYCTTLCNVHRRTLYSVYNVHRRTLCCV